MERVLKPEPETHRAREWMGFTNALKIFVSCRMLAGPQALVWISYLLWPWVAIGLPFGSALNLFCGTLASQWNHVVGPADAPPALPSDS